MSGAVSLAKASGGTTLLEAPDSASNFVVDLPNRTTTLDDLKRSGNVLQVVNATYSTISSSSSLSFVSSGLTASITPTSTTSKIIILITNSAYIASSSMYFTIYINSTNLASGVGRFLRLSTTAYHPVSINCEDSPNTLSATTYSLYYNSDGTSGSEIQTDGANATITLMELAG